MENLTDLEVPEQQRPDDLDEGVRLRWVPEYEGDYAVTDDGRVYSWKQQGVNQLSPHKHGFGYDRVTLSGKKAGACEDYEDYLVHRLVLRSFVGEPDDGEQCRHLNGGPSDNRLENLAWGTSKENSEDCRRHGRLNPHTKILDDSDVVEIRERYESTQDTYKEIAEDYPVQWGTVSRIVSGDIWSDAPGPTQDRKQLNETDVREIRRRHRERDETHREIAEDYPISRGHVTNIINGKTWKGV